MMIFYDEFEKALEFYNADHVIIIGENGFETYNIKKIPLTLWEVDE